MNCKICNKAFKQRNRMQVTCGGMCAKIYKNRPEKQSYQPTHRDIEKNDDVAFKNLFLLGRVGRLSA